MAAAAAQDYPRINEGKDFAGLLDERKLTPHTYKIPQPKLRQIIADAVKNANRKASRAILNIPEKSSDEEMRKIFLKEGRKLLDYFRQYCGDPPSTAYQCLNRHYSEVAVEQFRNRTLQKERMNSGWRYQFMAHDCAHESKRFLSVSDLGGAEADFNVAIATQNFHHLRINIYVSVKNRRDTVGGQDFPNFAAALETVAKHDQNRTGRYLCVFGIAMDRGMRTVRKGKDGTHSSVNTEIWLSDFFWPFFSNYTYEEVVTAVLEALAAEGKEAENTIIGITVPEELLESFGVCCRETGLVDEKGYFTDCLKLAFFLGGIELSE